MLCINEEAIFYYIVCTKPKYRCFLFLLDNLANDALYFYFQAAIRKELNEYKSNEMEVHASSKHLTRLVFVMYSGTAVEAGYS